jgi:hypothetical protein
MFRSFSMREGNNGQKSKPAQGNLPQQADWTGERMMSASQSILAHAPVTGALAPAPGTRAQGVLAVAPETKAKGLAPAPATRTNVALVPAPKATAQGGPAPAPGTRAKGAPVPVPVECAQRKRQRRLELWWKDAVIAKRRLKCTKLVPCNCIHLRFSTTYFLPKFGLEQPPKLNL